METEFVYKDERKCLAETVKQNILLHESLALQTCTSSQTVVYAIVCVCVRAAAMEAIRFSAGKRERVEEEKQRECVKYGRNVNCVYLHTLLLLCSIMQT